MLIDLTFDDLQGLYPEQRNCLLWFVYFLFKKDFSSGDLNEFSQFLLFTVKSDLFPKNGSISFGDNTLDPPRAPLIHAYLKDLAVNQYLEEINFNGHISWRINQVFWKLALQIFSMIAESNLQINAQIPAADRFVSIDDNNPELIEAKTALDKLSEMLTQTNDALTADPRDRIQLSREILSIKQAISGPRIHVVTISDAIKHNSTLKWLCEQAISGIVRQAAIRAVENLHSLWQFVGLLL